MFVPVLSALAYITYPNIDPVALQLGPVSVKWYGLSYAAGFLLGWQYVLYLLKDNEVWQGLKTDIKANHIDDLLIWVMIGAVAGGRLGQVLFYHPDYYFANPMEIFKVWKGGMASHGGMIGGVLAVWLFARKHQIKSTWTLLDLCLVGVPIGFFFGRIANFINAEIIGTVTTMPWGVIFPITAEHPDGLPRHPAMLYEALTTGLLLFVILVYMIHKRHSLSRPGETLAIGLLGYGGFRIFCEGFKFTPDSYLISWLPLTKGMIYSVPMIILGFYILHLVALNIPKQQQALKAI